MEIEGIYTFFRNLIPFIVAGIGALVVARQLLFFKNVRKAGNETVFDKIDQKFSSDLINDKDDIQLIINSVSRSEDEVYSLAPVLEDYYTTRLSKSQDIGSEEILRRYGIIKKIIKEENKEKPFSGVPDEERRILMNMNDALANNDSKSIEFNINELNSVLTTRNKVFESNAKLNKWSVPLAILGVFFTILFGILSFTPSKIDYEKINAQNKTILDEAIRQLQDSVNISTNPQLKDSK